jgi:hypothetical protein
VEEVVLTPIALAATLAKRLRRRTRCARIIFLVL